MFSDTVSDALIRIKNGYLAYKDEVALPYSKLVIAICKVLQSEGYLQSFKEVKSEKKGSINQIQAILKYEKAENSTKRKPALSDLKRISKPGLRIYSDKKRLPRVLNGLGVAIISTPRGVMTDRQARKEGVGGEIIAYIW